MTKQLKKTSFREFMDAIQTYKRFDVMLRKLGITRSNVLMKEVQHLLDEETQRDAKERASRKKNRPSTPFDEYVKNIQDLDAIPEIPVQAMNAVVINLFCIDENYESRSLEFVEYAFSLFPDREYIILTQPYTVPETTLLQNFIQIPMKKNSTFEHVLYIYHKDSLQSNSIFVFCFITLLNYCIHSTYIVFLTNTKLRCAKPKSKTSQTSNRFSQTSSIRSRSATTPSRPSRTAPPKRSPSQSSATRR